VLIGAAAISAAAAATAQPLSTAAAAHEIMNLVFINLSPKRPEYPKVPERHGR
jgi:hypothetical protein